jgi:hypothetical protein
MAKAKKQAGKAVASAKQKNGSGGKSKSAQGKPKPSSPEAAIAAARAAAYTDEDPVRAFEHFRPLAEKVPADGLAIFTGQPLLMRANIKAALEAIEPHLPAAVAKLHDPRLSDVFELPSLVMALDFAAGRVPVAKLSPGEIEKMLAEGAPWRELMLAYLEIAAHPLVGLLPRERVIKVRQGTGKLDKAQDFVAIPGLFTEFGAALAGKHPFPADKLELLGTLGSVLVQNVKPGRAVSEVPKRTSEAVLRDQLAELVTARYDHLEVLAAVALGRRKAAELLPALRSAVAQGTGAATGAPQGATAQPAAEANGASNNDAAKNA